MEVLSVSTQKGGVAKTTISFNLGASLSLKYGKRILLVDMNCSHFVRQCGII